MVVNFTPCSSKSSCGTGNLGFIDIRLLYLKELVNLAKICENACVDIFADLKVNF